MNDVINIILKRRSVRAFTSEMPSTAALEKILKCAAYAPSAMNTQNWHFSLVRKAELIGRINKEVCAMLPDEARERMKPRFNGSGDINVFYNAPVIIMVSAPKDDAHALVNAGLATQNICLAAESLGLNTCIIGFAAMLFNTPAGDKYLSELKIPEGYKPVHAVCVGFKNMEIPAAPERAEGKVVVIG